MNILYIDHYAGGPTYGMEYRPFYLAREWVRLGHNVTIVAAAYSHVRSRQPLMVKAYTEEIIEGVRHVWCATPIYQGNGPKRVINILAFLLRLCQWSKWTSQKPDVVIASSTYPLDIYIARRIAKISGATLVWEVHDLWPLSPIELGGISPRHPFMILLQHAENFACRSADVVVSMLPKAADHLREHGMAKDKFLYIPNGFDPEEWRGESVTELPSSHASAISQARSRGHTLIAHAGSMGVANALDVVLDAANLTRADPITWLLVGGGPEKDALRRRISTEHIDNVVLLDQVPKTTIPTILRAMDVLYIGFKREKLYRFGISPNKLIDYMMAERPVICGVDAGNDPVGEANCGLTIVPENPDALADAARQLAQLEPAKREVMGRRGRAYAEQQHGYPILARRFLEGTVKVSDRHRG